MKMFRVQIERDGGFTVPTEVMDLINLRTGDEVVLEDGDDYLRIRKSAESDHGDIELDENRFL